MKTIISATFLLFFLIFSSFLNAQENSYRVLPGSPEFEELKSTVEQFFQYMHDENLEGLKNMMESDITFTSINYLKSKEGIKHVISKEEFLNQVSKMQGTQWDEILEHYTMNMDKGYASVFIPYTFILNDVKSHCGVNHFQMVNSTQGWKVHSVFDTRRVCPVK